MTLPPYTDLPALSYGTIAPDLCVIHVSQNNSGLSVANYCLSQPLHWHWTVGQDGKAWKHLDYDEEGAHDAGLNERSIGIEHAGYCKPSTQPLTNFAANIAQLSASAQIVADFAHFLGKEPSRDWIIGHDEDAKYGGISTHTDPGALWPWDLYMEMVLFHYWEDEMTAEEHDAVMHAEGFAKGFLEGFDPVFDPAKKGDYYAFALKAGAALAAKAAGFDITGEATPKS